jgi:hypothetical protein
MKRLWIYAATLVLFCQAVPLHAGTQTWFGFQMGVSGGSAPPPPVVFRSEPHVIVVNDVQVVDDNRCDDDVFRTENTWWRLRGGYWYRSTSWRGPWFSVDVRRVPERVLVVPASHWKHHPRHDGRTVVVMRDEDRHEHHHHGDHDEHHHGHGHDHDGDDD